MSVPVRYGLIAGAIGLLVNLVVSTLFGICGPVVFILAGAGAGYFAARAVESPTRGAGARLGASAGTVAGSLVLLGQIVAAFGALALVRAMGNQTVFGQVPESGSEQVGFYVGAFGFAICIGIIGLALSAGSGAGTAYLATPERPAEPAGYPPYPPQTPSV